MARKGSEGTSTTPNPRTRSVAGAAQLLELWTTGRCVLNRAEVEHYVYMLQKLDMAVADMYDEHFVNEESHE